MRTNKSKNPNIFDLIVLTIVFAVFAAMAWGASQMASPYNIGEEITISLEPSVLPKYAVNTVLRMFIALFFSFLVTIIIAPLAAKNKHAEKFILPFIDIMQSIPVLGILSITVVGFIRLFPNSLLGPECAAIFAIFTSQVWNMILSLYQSLKTVPHDITEAATVYRLSGWQRFWKIELPHGTPALLWNTMVSMSAGWFFVVVSEAISVSNQDITLPGIGSYINIAIKNSDLTAIGYAILTMFIVILAYDQLIFRPLLAWAEKFKPEIDEDVATYESWFFDVLAKTHLLKFSENIFNFIMDFFVNRIRLKFLFRSNINLNKNYFNNISKLSVLAWYIILTTSLIFSCYILTNFILESLTLKEVLHVCYLGLITAIKVLVLIIISSLIWVPIGVIIGFNPKATSIVQPLIQLLAAFPANFFYPLFVIVILKYNLNKDICSMPLMILGTQWYILFNIIVGASNIPKEMLLATKNLGVKGKLFWKRLVIPAIFPYYTTGAMTAAGGCWNASIVAEFLQWGDQTIISTGLGSYIQQYTTLGDFPRIALGISIMCIYVILINKLVWQKMYDFANARFTLD